MHNIGSREEAQEILDWVRSFDRKYDRPTCIWDAEAPEGWGYLGSGAFRSVWLSPSGVAYKVEHRPDYDAQSSDELSKLRASWSLEPLEGCRLPKFQGYKVDDEPIVAIEAIKGSTLSEHVYGDGYDQGPGYGVRRELYSLLRKVEDYYRLWDMHDENAMVDEDGTLVPVDFGG